MCVVEFCIAKDPHLSRWGVGVQVGGGGGLNPSAVTLTHPPFLCLAAAEVGTAGNPCGPCWPAGTPVGAVMAVEARPPYLASPGPNLVGMRQGRADVWWSVAGGGGLLRHLREREDGDNDSLGLRG
jgi:hypothetical protein